jgi:pimeloyl-ACP methyl ester carboxylesterase
MSLWGADFYAVGKMFDMPKIWGEMASNLVTHAIPQCGHLPQEEQPEMVTRLLVDFLEIGKLTLGVDDRRVAADSDRSFAGR